MISLFAASAGIVVVSAAGNSAAEDSCVNSPGSASEVRFDCFVLFIGYGTARSRSPSLRMTRAGTA